MSPVPLRMALCCAAALAVECFAHEPDLGDPPNPVSLSEAVGRMTMPEGFRVTLFAAEPDVVQPIAMTTDARGRLWVVECLSYPAWQAKGEGRDRVIILEDTNHDGRFDAKRVFWDKGRNLTGIVLGLGGVWLCSAPELIFIPDRNHDDVPDGAPEVMLDGWTLEAKHNIVNGLAWGPDGWLYGCHGILADSMVGRPGAPESERTKINCGVWRFHPVRRVFEVVAHGMTNPWGITFDEHGQLFVANCVIKHLFHIIPGARYERMYGQDSNPYAFRLIESCADHIHWAGGFWKTEGAGGNRNEAAGGGHAHCGALIYQGDNWPAEYRNTFLTLNVHGHRINNDSLERRGSGFAAKHRPDFLKANDPWFRGVSLIAAADGSVFMSDWSDAGECHDYDDIHRENGRIYQISYGTPKPAYVNLVERSDAELARAVAATDDWHVSQARVALQERAANGKLNAQTRPDLVALVKSSAPAAQRLRALWALHVTGGVEEDVALRLLESGDEWLRAWTVQLAAESGIPSARLRETLFSLADRDPSPVVRRYLASVLERCSEADRVALGRRLAAHGEDASDPNLPLLIWYGIEPVVSANDEAAAVLLNASRVPVLREFIAQRLSLRLSLNLLASALRDGAGPAVQRDVIRGMFEALNGRRDLPPPDGWAQITDKLRQHPDEDIREKSLLLGMVFNDPGAAVNLRQRVADHALSSAARARALQSLVQARAPEIVPLLQSLLSDRGLRSVAVRGLAAFDDPATPSLVLRQYASFSPEERAEAITTLSSRPHYAVALLEAVKQGAVPVRDISPFAARQIQALKDQRIAPLLQATLGQFRAVAEDKAAVIAGFKKQLTAEALRAADLSHGRAVFNRTCAACHTLFDEGGRVGPELTGSQRSNLEYVLDNVVDPNAVVWSQYRATYFETSDDRLISGVVLRENESTVTIQTQTGTITLPRKDITARTESALSMMPEGLLESLPPQDVVDLVAYLQSPSQVPVTTSK